MSKTRPLAIATIVATIVLAFSAPLAARGRIDVEAVAGEPFGVGRVSFEPSEEMLPAPLGVEGLCLTEKHGRVFYPALDNPAFGKLLKGLLDQDTPLTGGGPLRDAAGGILRGVLEGPSRATFYFLFVGRQPLELSIEGRTSLPVRVVPSGRPAARTRLMQQWWRRYAKPSGLLSAKPDYPPLLETYLTSMLARRLNLRLPETKQTPLAYEALHKELGLNLGGESLRMAMLQDRMLGLNNLGEPADQPLPKAAHGGGAPTPPAPKPSGDAKSEPQVEPIAMRVPAECFYVRFGSFGNFLWLQDTLAQWGGDAQNLIALRGLDRGLSGRIEKQLVLKQTVLSRMLGDTVIADVAMVGTDMFFREGAAYGLLFQARNNLALGVSFGQQRAERLSGGGVKEEKVRIGGRDVSYLSSADGLVRSYYVADGDYHFITTSKRLAARFLATASGEGALGASSDFRHARSVMPISRQDTIWAYLSAAFFHNLVSPAYRVELARRLQATADIELVELARLAAAGEGKPSDTIEQLMSAGLLPAEFGPLPDGSHSVIADGEAYDSLRGHRGAFLPIGDVPVEKVSSAEAADYSKFIEFYSAQWGQMDPLTAAIKRTALKGNREQVVVDVLMSPFAPQHFEALKQWVGMASDERLAPVPDNLAEFDLTLTNQRLFGGLSDLGLPSRAGESAGVPTTGAPLPRGGRGGRLRDFLVGYIGVDGDLGPLTLLNVGIPPASDPEGYAMSPLGGWRRQYDRFTVFSFQRDVLDTVVPQLHYEAAERPAQIRLRIGDVSDARITPTLNNLAYARTRETSLGNLRLLHALHQQLRVPTADCRREAESLLNARLVCPLGGKYALSDLGDGSPHWTSTRLKGIESGGLLGTRAPEGYQAPPLSWFRGLDLDATMTRKTISAHAETIMQMPEKK
ncbi:MAG: hypothetical protein ABFC63_01270 [Thermoguttaceae bacterium]